MTASRQIHISTDGSFLPGSRPVTGWAWVDHATGLHDCGGSLGGNIQLGELCAILQALRSHPGTETLVIESDSRAAIEYATKRESTWSQTGWVKDNGNPAPYFVSVIRAIHMEMEEREGPIDFMWVKGHKGDEFNEQADQFARGYATMCRDFHAPSKIPAEAQVDLMRVPLQLAGRVIQTGNDDIMQTLDPSNSAAAKADASRAAIAAANTVGVGALQGIASKQGAPSQASTAGTHGDAAPQAPAPTARSRKASSQAAEPQAASSQAAESQAAPAQSASSRTADAGASSPAPSPAAAPASAPAAGAASPHAADSLGAADWSELREAQMLHDLTARLRKATHAQQDAAERYAKAAGIPPSARIAQAEDSLNKAARHQEDLAHAVRELVESLI